MSEAPKQPSETVLWLAKHHIGMVHVTSQMTGSDTSQVYVTLYPTGPFGVIEKGKERKFRVEEIRGLVDYTLDWKSVVELKRYPHREDVDRWLEFTRREKKDINEFNRLARKLGRPTLPGEVESGKGE